MAWSNADATDRLPSGCSGSAKEADAAAPCHESLTSLPATARRSGRSCPASSIASTEDDVDAEIVAIAGAIIRHRTGKFDPSTYPARHQEALRDPSTAEIKRVAPTPRTHLLPLRPSL